MGTPSVQPVKETPLAGRHRSAGAKMGVWFGCALPDDFGNATAEYLFARERVALTDKNYRAYLSFTGPDRVRYLNAILTNNIKDLATGQGIVSLLLNPQGHILAEIETYALTEALFCVSYAMIRQRLVEVLDKYIIMDDVTLTDETERYGTLGVEGPEAAAVAREVAGIELARLGELCLVECEVGAIPCRVVKRSPGDVAGGEFLVAQEKLAAVWDVLEEAVKRHGGGAMGYQALSARRLEQGVPWFGYDFSEKQIPHEAGLEHSHISYTKGCYTGQEIVERVRSRGHVNRRRVELFFAGDEVPEADALLTLDGKETGFVTRAARIGPVAGEGAARVIGMGYARAEGNAVGTELQWAKGSARVK